MRLTGGRRARSAATRTGSARMGEFASIGSDVDGAWAPYPLRRESDTR